LREQADSSQPSFQKERVAMKIRTSACLRSSLSTAAFQIVRGRDGRGLMYRCRRDIMSMRLLRQDPFPAGLAMAPRGRLQTTRDIQRQNSPVLHRETRK
jgi:hypothetical protein